MNTRNPHPDAAQLHAWRELWRLLLTPRPNAGGSRYVPHGCGVTMDAPKGALTVAVGWRTDGDGRSMR